MKKYLFRLSDSPSSCGSLIGQTPRQPGGRGNAAATPPAATGGCNACCDCCPHCGCKLVPYVPDDCRRRRPRSTSIAASAKTSAFPAVTPIASDAGIARAATRAIMAGGWLRLPLPGSRGPQADGISGDEGNAGPHVQRAVGLPKLRPLQWQRANLGPQRRADRAWPDRPGPEPQSLAAAAEDDRHRAIARGYWHDPGRFLSRITRSCASVSAVGAQAPAADFLGLPQICKVAGTLRVPSARSLGLLNKPAAGAAGRTAHGVCLLPCDCSIPAASLRRAALP